MIDPRQPRYRLLGPVAVYDEQGAVVGLGTPKQRSVLAALLLNANHAVSDERLFELVWGELPPSSVRNRLHVYISRLRALLGHEVIARTGGGYCFSTSEQELDLQVFTDLVARGRAATQPDRSATLLRAALALWHGPALGGVSQTLIENEGPSLDELRLNAQQDLFDAELAAGGHAEVIGELRQALSEHPYHERLTGQLMLALHRCERRSDALQLYAETRRKFVEDLGIEPGLALRELQTRILGDAERPAEPRPVTASATESTPQPQPAELPRAVGGLVGRDAEFGALGACLQGGGVCVISGPAGVGKTALAVNWAHSRLDEFPDGQLYVNLRGYDPDEEPLTPTAAVTQLLGSLGVPPENLPSTLDAQAALYRSVLAGRRVLVLLDNARDAAQVRELVPASGAVIVTSRHRLSDLVARTGARAISLTTLDERNAQALLEAIVGPARMAAEPSPAVELVRLCGGLPLALRIAGANLATHPTTAIQSVVTELSQGDRLAALAPDGAESGAVASAFSASYRALEPATRRVFRLLGLIPGPSFTVATAAALAECSVSEMARHLHRLTTAHVVERYSSNRYRFHDLVRLYAAKHAHDEPDHNRAWVRLVNHYLAIAVALTDRYGPGVQALLAVPLPDVEVCPVTFEPSDTEIPNLVASGILAVRQGPYPAAWALVDRLRSLFHRCQRRTEWLEIAESVLPAAEQHEERAVQAMLHHSIGESLGSLGQLDEATAHLRKAVRMAREIGWSEGEAAALAELGIALKWAGKQHEAIGHAEHSATLFTELGSTSGEAYALNVLGGQYHHFGQMHRAEQCYLRAHALSQRHGHEVTAAFNLMLLGVVWHHLDRVPRAMEALTHARDQFQRLGATTQLAWAHVWLGLLCQDEGDHRQARQLAARACTLAREVHARLVEAIALIVLAESAVTASDYPTAAEHLQQAINMAAETGSPFHKSFAYCAMAKLETGRHRYPHAIDYAHQARNLARENNYRQAEGAALFELTDAYLQAGKMELAEAAAQEALTVCKESGQIYLARRVTSLFPADQQALIESR